jgi:hypothetical protein
VETSQRPSWYADNVSPRRQQPFDYSQFLPPGLSVEDGIIITPDPDLLAQSDGDMDLILEQEPDLFVRFNGDYDQIREYLRQRRAKLVTLL